MKAYKIELLVIDFDGLGKGEIQLVLEEQHYPNHCITPSVMGIEGYNIGEWSDEHPLNSGITKAAYFKGLSCEKEN